MLCLAISHAKMTWWQFSKVSIISTSLPKSFLSELNPGKQCLSLFFLTIEIKLAEKQAKNLSDTVFSHLSFLAVVGIGEISHFFLIFSYSLCRKASMFINYSL